MPVKPDASVALLRRAVQHCQGCDVYRNATQAVFGEGDVSARMILIGEQPGDQGNLQGRPFVTVHPSSVLRLPEHDDRERAFQGFLADLQMAHAALRARQPPRTTHLTDEGQP